MREHRPSELYGEGKWKVRCRVSQSVSYDLLTHLDISSPGNSLQAGFTHVVAGDACPWKIVWSGLNGVRFSFDHP